MHATLVLIGDELGLYRAMAGAGPMTPAELATRTNTDERYIREWLNANAASGYVAYDATTRRYELRWPWRTDPRTCLALSRSSTPASIQGRAQDHPGVPYRRRGRLA